MVGEPWRPPARVASQPGALAPPARVGAGLLSGGADVVAQSDPLRSWNGGTPRKVILDFVSRTTTVGGAVGGLRVTGYLTPAARYCAVTGGRPVDTACLLPGGKTCDAGAYFAGTCARKE